MIELILVFGAGAFGTNALPHLCMGVTGRAFPTPFARPPGRGESSATLNVVWAFANLVAAYLLFHTADAASPTAPPVLAALTLGALVMALVLAWHFGGLYGGNSPTGRRGD